MILSQTDLWYLLKLYTKPPLRKKCVYRRLKKECCWLHFTEEVNPFLFYNVKATFSRYFGQKYALMIERSNDRETKEELHVFDDEQAVRDAVERARSI